jgi:hypothetical protein
LYSDSILLYDNKGKFLLKGSSFMRVELHPNMNIQQFTAHYWLKSELQTFCKQIGLQSAGSKLALEQRIIAFLTNGENISPIPSLSKSKKSLQLTDNLSLDTIIVPHHRCTQAVREFFKSHTQGRFHFSLFIQAYFRTHVGLTYRDALAAWFEEQSRNKISPSKSEIAPPFKYNQFTRDFFADPRNHGKSRQDAIAAWKKIKQLPGDHRYVSDLE